MRLTEFYKDEVLNPDEIVFKSMYARERFYKFVKYVEECEQKIQALKIAIEIQAGIRDAATGEMLIKGE